MMTKIQKFPKAPIKKYSLFEKFQKIFKNRKKKKLTIKKCFK